MVTELETELPVELTPEEIGARVEWAQALIFSCMGAKDEADFLARAATEKPDAPPILEFYVPGANGDHLFAYDSVPPGDPSRRTYWIATPEERQAAYPNGWGTKRSAAADALTKEGTETK